MGQYTCKVTITNNTSPAQNVTITAISGTFMYVDGSISFFTPNQPIDIVHLGPGQGKPYASNDLCVVRFLFYVTLSVPGSPDVVLPYDQVEPTGCLVGEWKYEPRP